MMKKVIITIMVIVTLLTTGTAAMLMIRGYAKEETTVETEQSTVVEEAIEASEELVDYIVTEVANMYVDAIYEVFGDDIDDSKLTCDNSGVYYGEQFASWEYLDDVCYNSMTNEYFGI